jgi:cobalt/nickel transport system permease protein
MRLAAFIGAGLAVAAILAFVVSPEASTQPDGLNKVASDQGFDEHAQDHPLDGSPLAGYGVDGVDNARLSKGFAGVIGVAVTFALCGGLFVIVRRRAVT